MGLVKKNWDLVAYIDDGKAYRVAVTAWTKEEACREIIHVKMAEGHAVKKIREWGELDLGL